jgi:hypothetical protein
MGHFNDEEELCPKIRIGNNVNANAIANKEKVHKSNPIKPAVHEGLTSGRCS